ncbi:amino acid ABC transporter ATP-binding protein [Neorhizobium sp. NCHU2750]|uniref:ABC transporter ATP-binding protein n=1 Tax=Neorhizobium sp. NCHU2750 TaxID=1825976 RepID=UPI000E7443F9|nr:amino acid ABC transporter ATP-binding protein [Neorhizobium sp. NCHU2750]
MKQNSHAGTSRSGPHHPSTTLRVIDVKKRFGPVEVLKGISLSVKRGEVISLLGSSGSGKSTFLRCLNFLEEPCGGEIWIRGRQVSAHRRSASQRQINTLRTSLGMVFQHFNLWPHKTAIENIIEGPIHVLGLPQKVAIERALALLNTVGMVEHRNAYPTHLSGGQQQRIAIARALAMEPDILLFDEPTSALDPELVGEVLKVIRTLADEGRTMLIVTHEVGFAREVSDRIIFLHAGRIEEEGRPDQILLQPSSPRLAQFLAHRLQGRNL